MLFYNPIMDVKDIDPRDLGLEGFFELALGHISNCEEALDYLETLARFGNLSKENIKQYYFFLDTSDYLRERLTDIFVEQWYRKLGKYD